MILEHRVGQGEPAAEEIVRAQTLVIANGFARGTSGVRLALLQRVMWMLNNGQLPTVRTLGSIGTSDLPANADLAYGVMDGLPLQAKEAIALINQNAFSTGQAALALSDALRLMRSLDVAAALDLEALGANLSILHSDDGTFMRLLEGTESTPRELQDPLSFRVVPHLHASARETLAFVRDRVERDLNRSQENPFVLLDELRIVSVGNFDVSAMSAALDFARIALAPVLTSASERAIKLLQSPLTGLPEGLAAETGLAESGLSEFGVPLQALAAEAKLLAQPVSIETASTSHHEGIEDRVTLAPLGARRLAQQVELGGRLAAIELTIAAQAISRASASSYARVSSDAAAHAFAARRSASGGRAPLAHELPRVRRDRLGPQLRHLGARRERPDRGRRGRRRPATGEGPGRRSPREDAAAGAGRCSLARRPGLR